MSDPRKRHSPERGGMTTARWEWKVLLGLAESLRVERLARSLLAPDPYTLASPEGGYAVASVYLAPPRGVRAGAPRWRVRRYGDDRQLWLEFKTCRGGRVTKRRVPTDAATALAHARNLPPAHPAHLWLSEVESQELRPAVVVSYLREAWVLPGTGARLTLDRRLRARPASRRVPESLEGGVPIVESNVLEFKFDGDLPPAFQRILAAEGLKPRPWSKVRAAVEALSERPLLGRAGMRTPGSVRA